MNGRRARAFLRFFCRAGAAATPLLVAVAMLAEAGSLGHRSVYCAAARRTMAHACCASSLPRSPAGEGAALAPACCEARDLLSPAPAASLSRTESLAAPVRVAIDTLPVAPVDARSLVFAHEARARAAPSGAPAFIRLRVLRI